MFGNLRKEGRWGEPEREAARGKNKEGSGVNITLLTRVKVLRGEGSFN